MKCRQIQDMMGAYLYGDLSPSDMREVRLHTQTCAQCREDLESRGRVVSAISNVAPNLTDEDRQSIAWTVKGALRHAESARRQVHLRWAPAFAVAALLIAGVAVGALITARAGKSPPPGAQAADPKGGKAPAVVRITEEQPRSSLNEKQVTASGSGNPDSTYARRRRPSAVDRMTRMLQGGASFAVGARKGKKSGHDQPPQDEPVVTTGMPEQHEPEPADGGFKLPEPTAPNNAQKSEHGTENSEHGTEGKERSESSTR